MSRRTLDTAMSSQLSLTGLSPSLVGLPRAILLVLMNQLCGPKPQNARILVWALSLSLAATNKIDVSFSSSPYLDVSVQEVPPVNLCVQLTVHGVFPCGFPHSDICGSMCICHSPQLFAAYHVFLRLLVPRHPPCALIASSRSLFFSDSFSLWFTNL